MRARAKRGRVERTLAVARPLGSWPPTVDFLRYPRHPREPPHPVELTPPRNTSAAIVRPSRRIKCGSGDRQPPDSVEPSSWPRSSRSWESCRRRTGTAPELEEFRQLRTAPTVEEPRSSTAPDDCRPRGAAGQAGPVKVVERSTKRYVAVSLAPSSSRPLLFAAVTPQPREGSPLRRWKHDRNCRRRCDRGPTARPAAYRPGGCAMRYAFRVNCCERLAPLEECRTEFLPGTNRARTVCLPGYGCNR